MKVIEVRRDFSSDELRVLNVICSNGAVVTEQPVIILPFGKAMKLRFAKINGQLLVGIIDGNDLFLIDGPAFKEGDFLWYIANGEASSYGKCKVPNDGRLRMLWLYGYRKATRWVTDQYDITRLHYHVFGRNSESAEPDHRVIEITRKGKTMVALYRGLNRASDRHYCGWYMHEDATIQDIEDALLRDPNSFQSRVSI